MKLGFSFSGLCIILFLIFMILKLCGVIAWSWVVVFYPLLILALAIFAALLIFITIFLFSKL